MSTWAVSMGLAALAAASDLPAPRTVELGPEGPAGSRSREDRPAVTAYLPSPEAATGAGVMVFPGGGFTRRCEDHEGVLVAEWLRAHGIAAFLVRYRVVPFATLKESLDDGHLAVQHVRAHAAQLRVSPRRLGAIGFSAGAVLAASVALRPRTGSRPDFLVLAYGDANQANPGIRGLAAHGLSREEAASLFAPTAAEIEQAPPTFLFCTSEDQGQARNMADLYARLLAARRPAEAHFFAYGEHGTGVALGDPLLGEWPSLLVSWLRTSGFLSDKARVALRGRVTVDGQPLPRGSVVLTPVGDAGAPAVVAYVFGTTSEAGEFVLPAERGPTPGRYRVEVRQDATRWASNSRDPVQQKLQARLRDAGTLGPEDVKAWLDSARAKDFSPSIDAQRVYTRLEPGDGAELTFDVPPRAEARLDLAIRSR
jgi:acetyl esterase/lipase